MQQTQPFCVASCPPPHTHQVEVAEVEGRAGPNCLLLLLLLCCVQDAAEKAAAKMIAAAAAAAGSGKGKGAKAATQEPAVSAMHQVQTCINMQH